MEADISEAFARIDERLQAHDERFDQAQEEFQALQVMLIEEFRRIDQRFDSQEQRLEAKLEAKLESKLEEKLEEKLGHYFGLIREDFDDRFRLLTEALVPAGGTDDAHKARVARHSALLENHEIRIGVLESRP